MKDKEIENFESGMDSRFLQKLALKFFSDTKLRQLKLIT